MSTRPLSIVQISDCHLMADPAARPWNQNNDANLQAVLGLARRRERWIDAVIATGDLVHDGSIAGYERLRAHLRRMNCPVLYLPGNHDCPATMEQVLTGDGFLGPGYHRLSNWQFVLLTSHVPGRDHGRLRAQDLKHLDDHLRKVAAPILVAVHHPPVAVGTPWLDKINLRNGRDLIERIQWHGQVRSIVFGHIHHAFDSRLGGLRLLGAPATTRQFLPGAQTFTLDRRRPGYRRLTLGSRGGVKTAIQRLPA